MKRFTRSFAVSVVGILFIIMRIFSLIWLGIRDVNITFKDDSLDFNISEIESVYQDCMRD